MSRFHQVRYAIRYAYTWKECVAGTAGVDFTPHVITVAAGEVGDLFHDLLIFSVCLFVSLRKCKRKVRNLNNVIM